MCNRCSCTCRHVSCTGIGVEHNVTYLAESPTDTDTTALANNNLTGFNTNNRSNVTKPKCYFNTALKNHLLSSCYLQDPMRKRGDAQGEVGGSTSEWVYFRMGDITRKTCKNGCFRQSSKNTASSTKISRG